MAYVACDVAVILNMEGKKERRKTSMENSDRKQLCAGAEASDSKIEIMHPNWRRSVSSYHMLFVEIITSLV